MAWNEYAKLEKSIETLHKTIQNQIRATNRQSKIMIWLNCFLVAFTVILVTIGVIQIKIVTNTMDTNSNVNQTQTDYNQPPSAMDTQSLPPAIKGGDVKTPDMPTNNGGYDKTNKKPENNSDSIFTE